MRWTALAPILLLSALPACGGDAGDAASSDAPGPGADGARAAAAAPDSTAARRLVDRSVAFHDPDGLWGQAPVTLSWYGTDGDGGQRMELELRFRPGDGAFSMEGSYRGHAIDYRAEGDEWTATVDGSSDLSPGVRERVRLAREDGLFWRNYFGFLAGLPMKIRDPGARLEPGVRETTFRGDSVRAVRLAYDPEVGGDVWIFYFDPGTAELVGARFHHDESAGDGEYLVFQGLATDSTLRLPRTRAWYVNADDRFLGRDVIRSVEVGG